MTKNVKLKNPPIYYALVQAKFNPVSAMNKYVNEIQDELRQKGYTFFNEQRVTRLHISEQDLEEPNVISAKSWLITNEDKTSGFILTTDSLVFHTTHYETHQEFLPELLLGLEVVHRVVKLEHISRLGLRYLDAILPSSTETVDQYLIPGLHGINFKSKQKYLLTESVFQTEGLASVSQGTLVERVFQVEASLGYPPDIAQNALLLKPYFEIKSNQKHAVIDLDHFVEESMSLEFEKIEEILFSLHKTIKEAFAATTTDYAQQVWS